MPPNIIVLMPDQHRSDMFGAAGDPSAITPAIDRLAAEGLLFDRAYCQGPLCMPARASFLTELYVRDHGINNNLWDLDTRLPTFVRSLRDAGYHTSCIGKMHLWVHNRNMGGVVGDTRERENQLRDYGFAEPIETVGKLAAVSIGSEYGDYLAQRGLLQTYREWTAARNYTPTKVDGKEIARVPIWDTTPTPLPVEDYIDLWHGRRVESWIREYDREEPFFLWVGFPGPHDPWDAPREYVERYRDVDVSMPGSLERPPLPDEDGPFRTFLQYFRDHHSDSANLTDDIIREVRRHYLANVTAIDDAIAGIVQALEQTGRLDDTWIVYTSDHGELMGEHRMLTKMVFYEPSILVPLVMRPPGGCAGQVVHDLVEHVDVGATFRAIAGADGHPRFEGRSLLGHFGGDAPGAARKTIRTENFGFACFRQERWKLVVFEEDLEPVELYDLESDPLEENNRVRDPEVAAVIEEILDSDVRPFFANGRTVFPPQFIKR